MSVVGPPGPSGGDPVAIDASLAELEEAYNQLQHGGTVMLFFDAGVNLMGFHPGPYAVLVSSFKRVTAPDADVEFEGHFLQHGTDAARNYPNGFKGRGQETHGKIGAEIQPL